jgi:hypothetical protein
VNGDDKGSFTTWWHGGGRSVDHVRAGEGAADAGRSHHAETVPHVVKEWPWQRKTVWSRRRCAIQAEEPVRLLDPGAGVP